MKYINDFGLHSMTDSSFNKWIDATLAEDLHSIRKIPTPSGNMRYAGERTADGHADRFWALALCNEAASNPVVCGAIWL